MTASPTPAHHSRSGSSLALLGLAFALLLLAPAAQAQTYTTAFLLTENPISQGGNWINGGTTGIDWGNISTTTGQTHDHAGTARYADSTALLTGTWGADQMAQGTVYAGSTSNYPEVELRLRSTLSAHQCAGYEISFSLSPNSYLIIVRWNGPLGDFTYLQNLSGPQYSVTTGDVVKATIVGNIITAYKNGVQMGQATDSTYASGNPGMGFNEMVNGTYGYTSYSAADGVSGGTPPTVATSAHAAPNPVTGTTTALAVLGADAGGEATLTYAWAATGTPPAAVAFSPNGTNAAKASTATFTKAGSYAISVTITDAGGLTAVSSTTVTVAQTLTTLSVTPATAAVAPSGQQQFSASAKDQFGAALASQPTATWTVSGGGSISAAGRFTGGATAGGPFTVTASAAAVHGTAQVTVAAPAAPTITAVTPTTGGAGTVVAITGTNLGGVTMVSFAGMPATFSVNGAGTQIMATVPAGAGSGPIAVTSPGGTATATVPFTSTAATGPAPASSSSGSTTRCGQGLFMALLGLVPGVIRLMRLRARTIPADDQHGPHECHR